MKSKIIGRVWIGEKGDKEFVVEFDSAHDAVKSNYQLWVSTGEDYLLTYNNFKLKMNDEKSFQECISDLEYQVEKIDTDWINSDGIL